MGLRSKIINGCGFTYCQHKETVPIDYKYKRKYFERKENVLMIV